MCLCVKRFSSLRDSELLDGGILLVHHLQKDSFSLRFEDIYIYSHLWVSCNTSKEKGELPGTYQDNHICFLRCVHASSPAFILSPTTRTQRPEGQSNLLKAKSVFVAEPRLELQSSLFLSLCHYHLGSGV